MTVKLPLAVFSLLVAVAAVAAQDSPSPSDGSPEARERDFGEGQEERAGADGEALWALVSYGPPTFAFVSRK